MGIKEGERRLLTQKRPTNTDKKKDTNVDGKGFLEPGRKYYLRLNEYIMVMKYTH
jgi:hypothetical protein